MSHRKTPRHSYRNFAELENLEGALSRSANLTMSQETRAAINQAVAALGDEVSEIRRVRQEIIREICCPRCKSAELTVMGPGGEEVRA